MAGYPWGGGVPPNAYMSGIVNAQGFTPQQALDNLAQQYQVLQQNIQQHQAMMGQQPMPMQQIQPQRPTSGLTVRAATNVDEVRATPIDPMTTNVFVNLAQGEVYISKIGDNGLKDIQTYSSTTPVVVTEEKSAEKVQETPNVNYKTAFDEIYSKLDNLYSRFDKFENMIGGAIKNADESKPASKRPSARGQSASNDDAAD